MKIYVRIGIFVLIGVTIIFVLRSELTNLLLQRDIEALQLFMEENIVLMLSLTFVSMAVQNTITLFPLVLLTTLNAALFGLFYGYVWSWVTSVVAAILVFWAARYLFQEWLISRVGEQVLKKFEDKGFFYVFLMRIFPLLPTSIINLAAGLTTIRFRSYFLATLIGNMIYIFALTFITERLLRLDVEQIILVLIIVFLLVLGVYMGKKRSKCARQKG